MILEYEWTLFLDAQFEPARDSRIGVSGSIRGPDNSVFRDDTPW